MNVFYLDMNRTGELPIIGALKSSCVHIKFPYKGWQKQKYTSENVTIPMSIVNVENLARWIQENSKKLQPKKGEFLVFWRKLGDGYQFGLAHDSRGIQKKYKDAYKEDQLNEFPRKVKV